MKEERATPLRQRMIEGMDIRGLCAKTQQGQIRCVKHCASFLGRSPDTATPEDLRAYQLQMTKDLVSATTLNVRIISLRFFVSVICGRKQMKRSIPFHGQPRKRSVVLSVQEVAKHRASVLGPRLKCRAAPGISNGAARPKAWMSGKGNCNDNAAALRWENSPLDCFLILLTFFKTIKAELIWRRPWETTRRQAETAIFQYINGFYYPRRRHTALGGKSPLAFE